MNDITDRPHRAAAYHWMVSHLPDTFFDRPLSLNDAYDVRCSSTSDHVTTVWTVDRRLIPRLVVLAGAAPDIHFSVIGPAASERELSKWF